MKIISNDKNNVKHKKFEKHKMEIESSINLAAILIFSYRLFIVKQLSLL